MSDPFISLAMHPQRYSYECDGKVKAFDPQMKTDHVNGKYLVVICEECSNVPVCHLLRKDNV